VRAARARVLTDEDLPTVPGRFEELAGARMIGGFTRRLTAVAGSGPAARFLVDAGIEVARLARQAAKLPREATAHLASGGARACWELDNASWIDLPGSCFTYSANGRALLDTREVSTPMAVELYSPPPAARRLFVRRKVMRLVRTGPRLHLFHSSHDKVHGFVIHNEIELEQEIVVAADWFSSRLPYQG